MRIYAHGTTTAVPLSSREVTAELEVGGWQRARARGDHWHFKHPTKRGKVTVQHPRKDIPALTLHDIERQSGLILNPRKRR